MNFVFFVIRCLRTIAQYEGASEHLCYSKTLPEKLRQIRGTWNRYKDIQDEARLLWYMIHKHIKPNRPKINGNLSLHFENILENIYIRMSRYFC
jgi:hypothetical protein